MEELKKLYYDVNEPSSFSSINNLYKAAKKQNLNVTLTDVKKFLHSQPTYTKHVLPKKRFSTSKVVAYSVDDVWQADIMYTTKPKANKNFYYVLVIIDVLSNFIWAYPLKKKTTLMVIDKFSLLFKSRFPSMLTTDSGTGEKLYILINIDQK